MMDLIRVARASLTRGETPILRDVSWTVHPGERWVILGPNGAGKTTLLTLVGARTHATSGEVAILGEDMATASVTELRSRIGLSSDAVAQRIASHELVRDVVVTAAFGATARHQESYDTMDLERAGDLLAAFGLAGYVTREFGTLSEGERKRVQLARALMSNPEVLLLDEPAAGLDLAGREELVEALAQLAADPDSPALVLVTHHVEEIPRGFTHVLILGAGQVIASGPIESTLTAEALSRAYRLPIDVSRIDGRWSARGRSR